MPLGPTRVLTISFALHFGVLAWVLPTRPPPVVEVFLAEAPVEVVVPDEPAAPKPVTEAEPEPRTPPSPAEATVEPAPAATPAADPVTLSPATPVPAVTRRPAQPRAVATVVPRPARPAPAPAAAITTGTVGAGIGTSAATAAPAVPPADYVAAVQAVLARQRRYPPDARARGAEGTAWLRFTIRRDGGIAAANVARSSGDPSLDAATEEMAARSVMPPLPEAWTAPTMTLMVPISYALR